MTLPVLERRRLATSSRGQINETTGLSLNRSQYGGCSTKYDTPTQTQVVYKGFGTPTLSIKLLVVKHGAAQLRVRQIASVLWWLNHTGRGDGERHTQFALLSLPANAGALAISSHVRAGF